MPTAFAVLATLILAGSSPAIAAETATAFVDVTIAGLAGHPTLSHQTVVAQGGTIRAIGAAGHTGIPRDARRIDGHGKYLIPGLVDSHVHFWGYLRTAEGNSDVEKSILNLLLAQGITTAIVMEGSPATLAIRDKVARGIYEGPRIFTSGPLIQAADTGGLPGRATFSTPEEVSAEVEREHREGFDFVKIHGGMSPDTYRALMDTARRVGLPVIGHIPDNLGLQAALESGQRQITHAESYLQTYFEFDRKLPTDPDEIARMVAEASERTRKSGAFVAPTLSVFHQIMTQIADVDSLLTRPGMRYIPEIAVREWHPPLNPYVAHFKLTDIPRLEAQYRVMMALVAGLRRAGVPLLAGTDDLVPCQLPGYSLQDEFEQLAAAGLSPREVLETATVNAARFLDRPGNTGLVNIGAPADLVLLTADPLDDVDNAFRREGVMAKGVWYSESELRGRLLAR